MRDGGWSEASIERGLGMRLVVYLLSSSESIELFYCCIYSIHVL